MTDLEIAWEKAWSLRPEQGTGSMEYLGTVERSGKEYLFYKDEEGNYWYDSRRDGVKDSERIRRKRRY